MSQRARQLPRQQPVRPALSPASAGAWLMIAGGLTVIVPGEPLAYVLPRTVVMAVGVALAFLGTRELPATDLDPVVAAAALVAALSAVFSVDRGLSLVGDWLQPDFGLLQLALYAGAFWLGASRREDVAPAGVSAAAAGGALIGLACLAQKAGLTAWPPLDHGRAVGLSGSPITAGACLALALPLALAHAAESPALGSVAASLIGLGLALTGTRSAWLAAAAGCGAYAWLSGRLKNRAARLFVVAALVAAVAGVAWVTFGRGVADRSRVEIWRGALRAAAARPWLGYGPDTFSVAFRLHRDLGFVRAARQAFAIDTQAHNDLLEAAATLGGLGVAAYLALQAGLVLRARRALARRPALAAAAAGALSGALLFAKVNPLPPQAWCLCAFLAGTLAEPEKDGARWRAFSLKAAAAALAVVWAVLWRADALAGEASRLRRLGLLEAAQGRIEAAASLAPMRLEYALDDCEITMTRAQTAASPERRKALAELLLFKAERLARRHARNPEAHEIYGTALLAAVPILGADRLTRAREELELASRLDPTHPYPIQRRMEVARQLKDDDAYRKAEEELRRLEAATGDARTIYPADRPAD